jgi:hypothetical protein
VKKQAPLREAAAFDIKNNNNNYKDANMLKSTEERYRKLARHFYKTRLPDTPLSTSAICKALTACAADYRPDYFRVLKNALAFDVRERGYPKAAKRILLTANPTTLADSTIPPKAKRHAVKAVSEDDVIALLRHLENTRHYDVFAAVTLAWLLGVRPSEMHSIRVVGKEFHITGAKKDDRGIRGADRVIKFPNQTDFEVAAAAVDLYQKSHRSLAAIRETLREQCRQLWPRRKVQPTLKSLRHQMGSNLKASGISPKLMAYIMGHQSTRSIERYGDRRTATKRSFSLPEAAPNADLSKVRVSRKSKPAWYSAEPAAKGASPKKTH